MGAVGVARAAGTGTFVRLIALTFTVGVVDAFAFDTFGVFTTNQAGNIVVFANAPWDHWPKAQLAGLSLIGAVLGVIAGTWLARRAADRESARLLSPVVLGAGLLVVGSLVRVGGTRPNWVIPILAAGTGLIAAGWMTASAAPMWLTANTGALLATARATVFPEAADGSGWWGGRFAATASRAALSATCGFVLGVSFYGLLLRNLRHPVLVGVIPTLAVVALLAREEWRLRSPAGSEQLGP